MNFMNVLFSLSTILAETVCCILLYNSLMEKRAVLRKPYLDTTLVIVILMGGFLLFSYFVPDVYIRSIPAILLSFIILVFFYRSNMIVKICCAVLPHFAIIAIDTVVLLLIMRITSLTYDDIFANMQLFTIATMIAKTFFSLIVIMIHVFMSKKKQLEYVTKRDWLALIGFSLFFTLALVAIMELCIKLGDVPIIVIPTGIGLMFSSLLVFWLLNMVSRQGRIVTENALIKQQLQTQGENIALLVENYNDQDKLMHEMKDRMESVLDMLNDGNSTGAASHIGELIKEAWFSLYNLKSKNRTIDAVLHAKGKMAKEKGLELVATLDDLSTLQVSLDYLVAILSNTIDNAIQACEKVDVENRIVELKMQIEGDVLVYSIVNPVSEHVEIIDDQVSKANKNSNTSGLGLQRVIAALRELNAEYVIICEGGQFQFTALINLANKMEVR